jgi:NitT/TauT family transport system ATP-binding protein
MEKLTGREAIMTTERPVLISVRQVTKTYKKNGREFHALRDCSFEVMKNEFLVIVGPTGCGKSTLLNLIAGLDFPSAGTILLNGDPVSGPGADRGVIFQEYALLPWRSVLKNVELGFEFRKSPMSRNEKEAEAMKYLDMVGLGYAVKKHPGELSGGMKRRASLAMILAIKPVILLMDGAFNALDSKTKMTMHQEITRIWETEKNTIVFVTSDLDEAVKLADRIVVLNREGSIEAVLRNELPRPRLGSASRDLDFHHRFIAFRETVMNVIKKDAGLRTCAIS